MLKSLFNKVAGFCGDSKGFKKAFKAPQRPAALLKRDSNTGVFL